jgi:hypothetical protein
MEDGHRRFRIKSPEAGDAEREGPCLRPCANSVGAYVCPIVAKDGVSRISARTSPWSPCRVAPSSRWSRDSPATKSPE